MTFLSKKFYTFFFVCLSILLWGCTEDTSEDFILDPDSELLHGLFPNDQAQNDSAAANLAHGIYLIVHPQAKYQLSFDVDPNYDAPELQLFRIYTEKSSKKNIYQQVRALEPQIVNNRYVYEFICEENEAIRWATSLVLDENYYPGKTSNIRLTGEGAFSDHFSINLIVVGNIEDEVKEDNDGFTIKEFAANLLSSFRKYYSSVTIDTLYLKFAHEHPTLGTKYPKDEPWIADPNSEDIMLSELGGWPGSESALDIVLVHHIKSEGILGTSGLFSGNMGEVQRNVPFHVLRFR